MTRMSLVRMAVLGAGIAGGMVTATAPAHAYYYGGYYGEYYGYRPYYVPFYRPRVLFVPPPVYVAPLQPMVVAPRVNRRRIVRARIAAPASPACICAQPSDSPFAGSGLTPAAVPGATAPAITPSPGSSSPITSAPGSQAMPSRPAAPPPNDVFPPERAFEGD